MKIIGIPRIVYRQSFLWLLLFLVLSFAACNSAPADDKPAALATAVRDDSAPVSAADFGCPESSGELQLLRDPRHGYCLLYQGEYKVEKPNDNETALVIGGLLNAGDPRVHINVESAGGRTAEIVADDIAAEFPPEFGIKRSSETVGGEPAAILDMLPGQDINRRVIFVHDGLLYNLMFSPVLTGDNQPNEALETFYDQILDSFTFVPRSDEVINECLAATDGTSLMNNESHHYCLLLPSNYQVEQPNEGEIVYFVGSLMDVEHPKLFVTVEDANGRTATEAADELMAGFPTDFGIETTFGQTIGYETAAQLDNVPGQDIARVLFVEHGGRLYKLAFVPATPDAGAAFTEMEKLFELVIRSFRFLP